MSFVFADTSYYVALANPNDVWHAWAVEFSRQRRLRILTTEFVLVELGNFLSQCSDRTVFLAIWKSLNKSKFVSIVPVSSELLEEGILLYSQRLDKDWSVTDCISFFVMDQRRVTEALTTDHHFEQAGFTVLLK